MGFTCTEIKTEIWIGTSGFIKSRHTLLQQKSYATQKQMLNPCKMVEKQSEAFHTFLWHLV